VWVLDIARCRGRSVVGGMIPFSFVAAGGISSCLFLLYGWPPRCLEDLETGVFRRPSLVCVNAYGGSKGYARSIR